MKSVCIGVRRYAEKLLNKAVDLLQKAVRTIARFITRHDPSNVSVENAIAILLDPHRFTTFPTLDNDLDLSIFLPLRLQDTSDRPDREDLVRIRLIDRRVVLRCKKDVALAGHSLFQSLDRTWPSDL